MGANRSCFWLLLGLMALSCHSDPPLSSDRGKTIWENNRKELFADGEQPFSQLVIFQQEKEGIWLSADGSQAKAVERFPDPSLRWPVGFYLGLKTADSKWILKHQHPRIKGVDTLNGLDQSIKIRDTLSVWVYPNHPRQAPLIPLPGSPHWMAEVYAQLYLGFPVQD